MSLCNFTNGHHFQLGSNNCDCGDIVIKTTMSIDLPVTENWTITPFFQRDLTIEELATKIKELEKDLENIREFSARSLLMLKVVQAAKNFCHGDQEYCDENYEKLEKSLTALWREENNVKVMSEADIDKWVENNSDLMDNLAGTSKGEE